MTTDRWTAADRRFWMVWREGGAAPLAKHPDRATAYAEAQRLAEKHPGARFFVLEAIGEVVGAVSVTALSLGPVEYAPPPAPRDNPFVDFHPTPDPRNPLAPIDHIRRQTIGDPRPGAAYDRPIVPTTGTGASYDYHPGPAG